jgi:DNA invertase Pin-like site-specific DNA recombinase
MAYVTYRRVSTVEQGASGLGLEAQQAAILHFLNGQVALKDFVEIQSGKESDNRPQLQAALGYCRATGSTLLVAKLDRLSRDTNFVTQLQKDGFSFIAADMPAADVFMMQIYAAVAQQERKMISDRTKAALKAAKERGVVLGGNRGKLTEEIQAKATLNAATMRVAKADTFALELAPIIKSLQLQGLNLSQIAATFNTPDVHILTASGKTGTWTAQGVKNVLLRNSPDI